MAFDPKNLSLSVDTIGGGSLRIHFYKTDDSEEVVSGDGYFAYVKARGVNLGDLIVVFSQAGGLDGGTFVSEVTQIYENGSATVTISRNYILEFESVQAAADATIPSSIKSIRIQFRDPDYSNLSSLIGGGKYVRISKADIDTVGYDPLTYFRSQDRFLPDGADEVNGGYWLEYLPDTSHDVPQSNIFLTPDTAAAMLNPANSPDGVNYFNTVIASSAKLLTDPARAVRRVTALGHAIGENVFDWERVEAIGNGAMRFARLGNRNTAVGSLALQWLGDDAPEDHYHDFWLENGYAPTDPLWDAYGLETRNPGNARAGILATTYASSKTDIEGNVAIGRNTLLHLVNGVDNTAVGYNSQAHAWKASRNTTVGVRAGRDNLFGSALTAIGQNAGVVHQQGDNDTYVGAQSAAEWVRGGFNTIIGANAGRFITDGVGNVLIGYGAGQSLGLGATVSEMLAIARNATDAPLVIGNFSTVRVGVGKALPANLLGTLNVVTESLTATPSANADDLVVMNNTLGGISILTPNNVVGQLAFGDPESGLSGGIRYDHATDRMFAYAAGAAQQTWGASGYWVVPNMQTTAPSAGSKRMWADPADGYRVKWVN